LSANNNRFNCNEFDIFKEFVIDYWKPNCEISIKVTEHANIYNWLCDWFEFLNDPDQNHNPPDEVKISIGPFINITPYGKFELGPDKDNENVWEFLFIDEGLDKTKLTKHFLRI
jgi:hypothetical protein